MGTEAGRGTWGGDWWGQRQGEGHGVVIGGDRGRERDMGW